MGSEPVGSFTSRELWTLRLTKADAAKTWTNNLRNTENMLQKKIIVLRRTGKHDLATWCSAVRARSYFIVESAEATHFCRDPISLRKIFGCY